MKVFDLLIKIIEKLCFLLMAVMVVVTFAQVINRYIFKGSFFWAEECTILCMIWVAFLGAAVAMRRNQHTRIDFLINLLPAGGKKFMEVLDYGIIAVFLAFLGWKTIPIMWQMTGIMTIGMKIPRTVLFAAVFSGCVLVVIYCLLLGICTAIGYDIGVKTADEDLAEEIDSVVDSVAKELGEGGIAK